MQHRLLKMIFATALTICLSTPANAVFILDTGTPLTVFAGPSINFGGQYYSGKFSISETNTITSVEGYMQVQGAAVGDVLTAALYDDSNNLPGSELFSTAFSTSNPPVLDWRGAFGLNWLVLPGIYWLSFEARSATSGSVSMPSGVPNPIIEAVFKVNINTWEPECITIQNQCVAPKAIASGFRIAASNDSSSIPEPTSLLLMGLGLAGLGFARRRRLNK